MTLRDVDVEYGFDDPDDGWFGQALPVDTMVPAESVPNDPAAALDSSTNASADTDRWYVADVHHALRADATPAVDHARPRPDVGPASWADRSWEPRSWESTLSRSGAWDFRVASPPPWYRSRRGLLALLAAVVLLIGVGLVVMRAGGSPAPAGNDPAVTPVQPTAQPAQTSSAPAPAASSELPPPPLPPPPAPPPSAEPAAPPAPRQYPPSQRQTSEPSRPEINVTRTPMSATPPPPPRPDRNSSTPGDGRKRGGWGF